MAVLHCDTRGEGPPLVALHGFGASSFTWHRVLPVLAARRTVHAVDLKGHGQSPKPRDGRYGVHDQAELVAELIAERRLRGITLVGHSFGGGVALALALRLLDSDPGVVSSLILIDAAAYRQRLPLFIRALRIPILSAIFQHVVPIDAQVRAVLRIAYHHPEAITGETVAAYGAALRMPGGLRALRETARHIEPPDLDAVAARYGTIRVPTLILWGPHDAIVPASAGGRLHEAIRSSTLVTIPDTSHVPHEEDPDTVCVALEEFLATPPRA